MQTLLLARLCVLLAVPVNFHTSVRLYAHSVLPDCTPPLSDIPAVFHAFLVLNRPLGRRYASLVLHTHHPLLFLQITAL